MWTKLRPGLRAFLQRAAVNFELHICTMGDRDYAQQIAARLAAHDCRLAAQGLVENALDHGGRDNVTVVVTMAIDPAHDEMTAINPALDS